MYDTHDGSPALRGIIPGGSDDRPVVRNNRSEARYMPIYLLSSLRTVTHVQSNSMNGAIVVEKGYGASSSIGVGQDTDQISGETFKVRLTLGCHIAHLLKSPQPPPNKRQTFCDNFPTVWQADGERNGGGRNSSVFQPFKYLRCPKYRQ